MWIKIWSLIWKNEKLVQIWICKTVANSNWIGQGQAEKAFLCPIQLVLAGISLFDLCWTNFPPSSSHQLHSVTLGYDLIYPRLFLSEPEMSTSN